MAADNKQCGAWRLGDALLQPMQAVELDTCLIARLRDDGLWCLSRGASVEDVLDELNQLLVAVTSHKFAVVLGKMTELAYEEDEKAEDIKHDEEFIDSDDEFDDDLGDPPPQPSKPAEEEEKLPDPPYEPMYVQSWARPLLEKATHGSPPSDASEQPLEESVVLRRHGSSARSASRRNTTMCVDHAGSGGVSSRPLSSDVTLRSTAGSGTTYSLLRRSALGKAAVKRPMTVYLPEQIEQFQARLEGVQVKHAPVEGVADVGEVGSTGIEFDGLVISLFAFLIPDGYKSCLDPESHAYAVDVRASVTRVFSFPGLVFRLVGLTLYSLVSVEIMGGVLYGWSQRAAGEMRESLGGEAAGKYLGQFMFLLLTLKSLLMVLDSVAIALKGDIHYGALAGELSELVKSFKTFPAANIREKGIAGTMRNEKQTKGLELYARVSHVLEELKGKGTDGRRGGGLSDLLNVSFGIHGVMRDAMRLLFMGFLSSASGGERVLERVIAKNTGWNNSVGAHVLQMGVLLANRRAAMPSSDGEHKSYYEAFLLVHRVLGAFLGDLKLLVCFEPHTSKTRYGLKLLPCDEWDARLFSVRRDAASEHRDGQGAGASKHVPPVNVGESFAASGQESVSGGGVHDDAQECFFMTRAEGAESSHRPTTDVGSAGVDVPVNGEARETVVDDRQEAVHLAPAARERPTGQKVRSAADATSGGESLGVAGRTPAGQKARPVGGDGGSDGSLAPDATGDTSSSGPAREGDVHTEGVTIPDKASQVGGQTTGEQSDAGVRVCIEEQASAKAVEPSPVASGARCVQAVPSSAPNNDVDVSSSPEAEAYGVSGSETEDDGVESESGKKGLREKIADWYERARSTISDAWSRAYATIRTVVGKLLNCGRSNGSEQEVDELEGRDMEELGREETKNLPDLQGGLVSGCSVQSPCDSGGVGVEIG